MTNKKIYNVNEQEKKDAYITTRLLMSLFSGNCQTMTFTRTCVTACYDLGFDFSTTGDTNFKYAFEIKERKKSPENIAKWGEYSELTCGKYERVMSSTNDFDKTFYTQLVNDQYALIYDLTNLDWSKVKVKPWRIFKDQYKRGNEKQTYLTLFIPYSCAIGKYDISQYAEEAKEVISKECDDEEEITLYENSATTTWKRGEYWDGKINLNV